MHVECEHCDGYGNVYDQIQNALILDSCPHCKGSRKRERFARYCIRTRTGEIHNRDFVEGLHNAGVISSEMYEYSKQNVTPRLLSGESGIGKTVLIKALYNRALSDMDCYPHRIRFWREKELVDIFRDEEKAMSFFAQTDFASLRYVFLDEMLDPANWLDRYSDRHFANLKHSNLWRFFDDLYDSNAVVVMATNTDPVTGTMPNGRPFFSQDNEHDMKLVRRILEMTGNTERWNSIKRRGLHAVSKA